SPSVSARRCPRRSNEMNSTSPHSFVARSPQFGRVAVGVLATPRTPPHRQWLRLHRMGEGQAGRQHRGSEGFQEYGIDAEGYADDTERNTFDPYEGHPALGGSD